MLVQGSICPTIWGNTGVGNCAFGLDKVSGFFITARSKGYDMSQYATEALFLAALQADAIAALPANRLYPIFHVADVTSNTGDVSTLESAYGSIEDIALSQIRWTVNMTDFGLKTLANMNKYTHNKGIAVWPIYMGANGNDSLQTRVGLDGKNYGFDARVYTSQPSPSAGATKSFQQFMIAFEDRDAFLSDKVEFIPTSSGVKFHQNLHGIHDVKLKIASASTTAITVAAIDAASGAILGDLYEEALEQVSTPNFAWLLNLVSTGANVPITSCTWNSTTKLFTLAGTFTTAAHKLTLNTPTALASMTTPFGNGITGGFESNIVDVTPA
jgi:hypothetical protein